MRFGLYGGSACIGIARAGDTRLLQTGNTGADLRHRRHRGLLTFQDRAATLLEIGSEAALLGVVAYLFILGDVKRIELSQ